MKDAFVRERLQKEVGQLQAQIDKLKSTPPVFIKHPLRVQFEYLVDSQPDAKTRWPDISVNDALRVILDYLEIDLFIESEVPAKVVAKKRTKKAAR